MGSLRVTLLTWGEDIIQIFQCFQLPPFVSLSFLRCSGRLSDDAVYKHLLQQNVGQARAYGTFHQASNIFYFSYFWAVLDLNEGLVWVRPNAPNLIVRKDIYANFQIKPYSNI